MPLGSAFQDRLVVVMAETADVVIAQLRLGHNPAHKDAVARLYARILAMTGFAARHVIS